MSATPAKELDKHKTSTASNSNQPKSFNDYTTPSPTDEESTKSLSGGGVKTLDSSSEFLQNLKSYRNNPDYHHHLSMDKLLIKNENHQETTKKTASTNKSIIDEKIFEILGLQSNIEHNNTWSYNAETLNELIKLKIEQERTKQDEVKKEFTMLTIELINLIKGLNLNDTDLFAYIFLSDSTTSEDLKNKINQLTKLNPKEFLEISSHKSSGVKRKHSDTQLPSFSETTQSIKNQSSTLVSPLRSPNKSPIISHHRRIVSDSSDSSLRNTKVHSPNPPPITNQLPLPPQYSTHNSNQNSNAKNSNLNSQNHSQQHSPVISHQMAQVQPPHAYPVYYQTPQSMAQPQPSTQDKTILSSPYQQKYQMVYNASSYPPPPQQVPYYVSTSPQLKPPHHQLPPQPHHQQYVFQQPPPLLQQIPPQPPKQSVPTHQFESPENNSRKSDHSHRDGAITPNVHNTTTTSKRHKNSKNNNGNSINFMITTPKNPPARKYNNPKEKHT
ncbi:unnamed protein product [Candida verbasci]|uniref:Uncharacterized protein n=1 Tax=Candida verbasci TaxID=1227364 RepID=A0A9W4X854_9ASCO|nr:unnamed protein product [Candida verbasci]